MKLLLISTSYPPVLGGLQTVARQVAQHMHQRGHAVRVLTMRYPRRLPSQEVLDGVPITRWMMLRPNHGDLRRGRLDIFLAACLYYPLTLWRLERLFQTFQPHVVNFHFPTYLTHFVLWLRRRHTFRLVISLHGDDVLGYATRSAYEKHQFRQLMAQADAITACSANLLQLAIDLVPSIAARAAVHYNGVELARFADQTPFVHPRPYMFTFGRLVATKGFDLLLDAFARIAAASPDLDLLVAGDGELQQALRTQADQLGIHDRVYFLGRATPGQVVQLLNGAQFVVLPSRSEPFGITAVEAMAAGKAVLATRVGGFPEVLPVPPNQLVAPEPEALCQALADWLGRLDEVRQLGEQNRVHAQRFDLTGILRQYEATLLGTCNEAVANPVRA